MPEDNFYRKIENKYYDLMESIDGKGIPVYKVIDFIEERNIPSFPVFIVFILALVLGIGFLLSGFLQPTVLVSVSGNGQKISLANVELVVDGEIFSSGTTDESGNVLLVAPSEKNFSIQVSKAGFEDKTLRGLLSDGSTVDVELLEKIGSRIISFKDDETGALIEQDLVVTFYCSDSDFETTRVLSDGTIELENVPGDCGTLTFRQIEGFESGTTSINVNEAESEIVLKNLGSTGIADVIVTGEDGLPVFGATVSLMSTQGTKNEEDDIVEQVSETTQAGIASFESVPLSDYYVIVADDEHEQKKSEIQSLSFEALTFSVSLEKTSSGIVKVRVKNAQNELLKDAQVKLVKEDVEHDSGFTDESGTVELRVNASLNYNLIVSKQGFAEAKVSNVSVGEEFYEISLTKATASNTANLVVKVIDSESDPVENAKILLKYADGETAGEPVITGIKGKAEFFDVAPGRYYVHAVKEGFEGVTTNEFSLNAGQQKTETFQLKLGFGQIDVIVLNDDGEKISGATVKAYDFYSQQLLDEKLGSEGTASFNLRVDRLPFFVITHPDYSSFTSATLKPVKGLTQQKKVELVKNVSALKAEFLGLFLNEQTEKSLNPGTKYTAKMRLLVPETKTYSKVGFFLRTGEGVLNKTNKMEEDSVFIKNVKTSADSLRKGMSYTPNKGFSSDAKNLTSGNAKWVQMEWEIQGLLPKTGVFEVEAEIQVKSEASIGDSAKISYRGFGISGNTIERNPVDNELGTNLNSSSKNGLYANSGELFATIGPSNLCFEGFCKTFAVEDLTQNIRTSIITDYPAQMENSYKLFFTINKDSPITKTNSFILIKNETASLLFKDYQITDAAGQTFNGNADGYEVSRNIGSLQEGSTISGNVVFEPQIPGRNLINISVISENQVIATKNLYIIVEAPKVLHLDIIPKTIAPMIDNSLMFKVTDESGKNVSNATISLLLNDVLIKDGKTNSDGVMTHVLRAPRTGSELKAVVRKNGYKTLEKIVTVDDSIFTLSPEELNIDLKISSGEQRDVEMLLNNLLPAELEITDARVSDNLSGLIQVNGLDALLGETVETSSSKPFTISVSLTDSGKLVEETKLIESILTFTVVAKDTQIHWNKSVPLNIRILLGKEVDFRNCLIVNPKEWRISSGGATESVELDVRNDCKISGTPVPLKNLSAKIDWGNKNALGEFSASGSEIRNMTIGEEFGLLSETISSNFDETITLTFSPDASVKSGRVNSKIILQATHLTLAGEEKIKAGIETGINLNNLSECVQVEDNDIEVATCAPDTGFGNYSQYGFYDPYATGIWGQPSFAQAGYGYGNYPGTLYPRTNQTGAFGSPNSQWACGAEEKAKLVVNNSCSDPVEIFLDPDGGVSLSNDSIILNPNRRTEISVEAGTITGLYDVAVEGRIAGSDSEPEQIDVATIKVARIEDLQNQCRPVVEPTNLRVPFIGSSETELKITNNCFGLGYRLDRINASHFNCGAPQGYGFTGRCALISHAISSQPLQVEDNKEIMHVKILMNPGVSQNLGSVQRPQPFSRGSTLYPRYDDVSEGDDIFDPWVLIFGSTHSSVKSQALLQVPMITPRGKRMFEEQITITNPLDWVDIVLNLPGEDGKGDGGDIPVRPPTPGEQLQLCSSDPNDSGALTGENAFESYGFDRIKFDWRKNEIGLNACAVQGDGFFCDSTQFTLMASKWVNGVKNEINSFFDSVNQGSVQADLIQEFASDVTGVKEFYRLSYAQAKIENDAGGTTGNKANVLSEENFYFFVSKEGELLKANELIGKGTECRANVSGILNSQIAEPFLEDDQFESLYDETGSIGIDKRLENCYGENFGGEDNTNNVLILLNSSLEENALFELFKGLGIIEQFDNGYVMTFDEYYHMRLQLINALTENGDCGQENVCKIQYNDKIIEESFEAWAEFLGLLVDEENAEFVLGFTNSKGLSDSVKIKILENGNNLMNGESIVNDLASSGTANVYLMEDGFSEDFREDFDKKYRVGINDWTFSVSNTDEFLNSAKLPVVFGAGEYLARINIQNFSIPENILTNLGASVDFENSETVIELAKQKRLIDIDIENEGKGNKTNYSENMLLKLPFDGDVGFEDEGVGDRKGYGTRHYNRGSEEFEGLFVVNEKNSDNKLELKKTTIGLEGKRLETVLGKKAADTQRGILFHIEGTKYSYTPSVPLKILMNLEKGERNVYYGFLKSVDGSPEPLQFVSKEDYGNTEHLIEWKINETDEQTQSDFIETEFNDSQTCNGWENKTDIARLSFEQALPENKTITSTSFFPENTKFARLCSAKPATIQVTKRKDGLNEGVGQGITIRELESETINGVNFEGDSVARFVNEIRKGDVCFKSSQVSLELKWNPNLFN